MTFLSCCKTERECIRFIEKELVSNGYRSLDDVIEEEGVLKPGDKIYRWARAWLFSTSDANHWKME